MLNESAEQYPYLLAYDIPSKEQGYWSDGIDIVNPGAAHMKKSADQSLAPLHAELVEENAALRLAFKKSGVPTIILPYPGRDQMRAPGIDKGRMSADVEFRRDPSRTAPDGRMFLFNMGANSRKEEVKLASRVAQLLGIETVDQRAGEINEGGNIRIIKGPNKENWYFGSVSTRSSKKAHTDLAGAMGITNTVLFEVTSGVEGSPEVLHLDCMLMPHVDPSGKIVLVTHMDGITAETRPAFVRAANILGAEIADIPRSDYDRLTTNRVQINGAIIGGFNYKNCQLEKDVRAATPGVKHLSAPQPIRTTMLDGSVHCLTTEIVLPEPVDEVKLRKAISDTGLFQNGHNVTVGATDIFNNYT